MITFPATSEAFITYQEQLVGRELSEKREGGHGRLGGGVQSQL